MDIGPIRPIRSLPVTKAPPANPELSAVFDIENFARVGDETYTPGGGHSAAADDEFDGTMDENDPREDDRDDAAWDRSVDSSATPFQARDGAPVSRIHFFA